MALVPSYCWLDHRLNRHKVSTAHRFHRHQPPVGVWRRQTLEDTDPQLQNPIIQWSSLAGHELPGISERYKRLSTLNVIDLCVLLNMVKLVELSVASCSMLILKLNEDQWVYFFELALILKLHILVKLLQSQPFELLHILLILRIRHPQTNTHIFLLL